MPDSGCLFSLLKACCCFYFFFFFQAEDGIRDLIVTGVQTCALPICVPAFPVDIPSSLKPRRQPPLAVVGTSGAAAAPAREPDLTVAAPRSTPTHIEIGRAHV